MELEMAFLKYAHWLKFLREEKIPDLEGQLVKLEKKNRAASGSDAAQAPKPTFLELAFGGKAAVAQPTESATETGALVSLSPDDDDDDSLPAVQAAPAETDAAPTPSPVSDASPVEAEVEPVTPNRSVDLT